MSVPVDSKFLQARDHTDNSNTLAHNAKPVTKNLNYFQCERRA